MQQSVAAADDYYRRVMSGQARGPVSAALRAAAAMAEPVYSRIVRTRNSLYDTGRLRNHDLGRPVVSVGNLSAGGTGKTPIVAFLANQLAARGRKPAILLRGYKGRQGEKSDEQAELEFLTARSGVGGWKTPVVANGDRVAGAGAALRATPEIDVFLLDDGFQHRRARRQVDIVLISASQGLCGGRVLPRGLLREPVEGLQRASAIILTRADQVLSHELADLKREVERQVKPGTEIFCCTHAPTEVTSSSGERLSPAALRGQRVFAVTGTGDPDSFGRTLASLGAEVAGVRVYADHHPYTPADRHQIELLARAAGATALMTTGKDAVKLLPLQEHRQPPFPENLPLWTLHITPEFWDGGAGRLVEAVVGKI
jgi:tetraacyldisaccharide 4'-kinase